MLYPSIALSALGYGLAAPALAGLISRRAGDQEQGALLGTAQSASSLTRVAGPVWAGAVFDHLGQGAPYWSGALFSLLAAWWAWHTTHAREAVQPAETAAKK
jgi:MFS family permease